MRPLPPQNNPTPATRRIDALPASVGLWSFITLLALGGFFELYDLFSNRLYQYRTAGRTYFPYRPTRHFGISDQASFASATFFGLFIGASLLAPLADKLGRRLTFMFALAGMAHFHC